MAIKCVYYLKTVFIYLKVNYFYTMGTFSLFVLQNINSMIFRIHISCLKRWWTVADITATAVIKKPS
jgi:hypothetical protein